MKFFGDILRVYLIFFNIFLSVISIALVAGVVYYFLSADQFKGVTQDNDILVYTVIPLVVIVIVAIVLVFLSVLGLISSCGDVKPLLILYAIVLGAVVVLQIIGGGLVLAFKDHIVTELGNGFLQNMKSYDTNDAFKEAADAIQTDLQCCGVHSYTDWYKQIDLVPQSCCREAGCVSVIPPFIYSDGCLDKLNSILTKFAAISISVAIVLAFIQGSGVVAAVILGAFIKKEERVARFGSVFTSRRDNPLYVPLQPTV